MTAPEVTPEQLFENIALDNKLITKYQLKKAKAALDKKRAAGEDIDLGGILVELEFITDNQLRSIEKAHGYRQTRNDDKRLGRQLVRMQLIDAPQAATLLKRQKTHYETTGETLPLETLLMDEAGLSEEEIDDARDAVAERDAERSRRLMRPKKSEDTATIECPSCGAQLIIRKHNFSKTVKCSHCQARFVARLPEDPEGDLEDVPIVAEIDDADFLDPADISLTSEPLASADDDGSAQILTDLPDVTAQEGLGDEVDIDDLDLTPMNLDAEEDEEDEEDEEELEEALEEDEDSDLGDHELSGLDDIDIDPDALKSDALADDDDEDDVDIDDLDLDELKSEDAIDEDDEDIDDLDALDGLDDNELEDEDSDEGRDEDSESSGPKLELDEDSDLGGDALGIGDLDLAGALDSDSETAKADILRSDSAPNDDDLFEDDEDEDEDLTSDVESVSDIDVEADSDSDFELDEASDIRPAPARIDGVPKLDGTAALFGGEPPDASPSLTSSGVYEASWAADAFDDRPMSARQELIRDEAFRSEDLIPRSEEIQVFDIPEEDEEELVAPAAPKAPATPSGKRRRRRASRAPARDAAFESFLESVPAAGTLVDELPAEPGLEAELAAHRTPSKLSFEQRSLARLPVDELAALQNIDRALPDSQVLGSSSSVAPTPAPSAPALRPSAPRPPSTRMSRPDFAAEVAEAVVAEAAAAPQGAPASGAISEAEFERAFAKAMKVARAVFRKELGLSEEG